MKLTRSTAAAVLGTLVLAACGGGSGPKVGDCIDAQKQVVDCGSASAAQKLVSDQSAKNAIACVEIGDKPQVRVSVDGHPFCAESR